MECHSDVNNVSQTKVRLQFRAVFETLAAYNKGKACQLKSELCLKRADVRQSERK